MQNDPASPPVSPGQLPTCQSIDWFAEGQAKSVEVGGVRVTVRFVGRKGRRARICIEAPAGAVFKTDDARESA